MRGNFVSAATPKAKLRRALIAIAALVIAALPLALVMEDFVRDVIVTPLAYEVWLIGVIVRALPQGYILTATLLIATYVALRSVQRTRYSAGRQATRKSQPRGVVTLWHNRLQQVRRGTYSKPRFDQLLGRLVLRILAFEHHLPMRLVVSDIDTRTLDIPIPLQSYAQAALRIRTPSNLSWYTRVRAWLRGKSAGAIALEALIGELEPALAYLESHLRVPHLEVMDESSDTRIE